MARQYIIAPGVYLVENNPGNSYIVSPGVFVNEPAGASNLFIPVDWPNPRGPSRANQDWILGSTLRLPVPAAGTPFAQFGWPNPQQPRRANQGWERPTSLATQSRPFNQSDWPNPRGPAQLVSNFTIILGPQPVTPIFSGPFNQFSWPVPASPPVQGWRYSHATGQVPTRIIVLSPFSQLSWPVPQSPRYDYRIYSWTLAPTFASPEVPWPFDGSGPLKVIRDYWDRDDYGNFVPGPAIRYG